MATGFSMGGDFIFDVVVDDDGLLTPFRLLEDIWAVSVAARNLTGKNN